MQNFTLILEEKFTCHEFLQRIFFCVIWVNCAMEEYANSQWEWSLFYDYTTKITFRKKTRVFIRVKSYTHARVRTYTHTFHFILVWFVCFIFVGFMKSQYGVLPLNSWFKLVSREKVTNCVRRCIFIYCRRRYSLWLIRFGDFQGNYVSYFFFSCVKVMSNLPCFCLWRMAQSASSSHSHFPSPRLIYASPSSCVFNLSNISLLPIKHIRRPSWCVLCPVFSPVLAAPTLLYIHSYVYISNPDDAQLTQRTVHVCTRPLASRTHVNKPCWLTA